MAGPAVVTLGSGKIALHAGAVLTPTGWVRDKVVHVSDGRILSIQPAGGSSPVAAEELGEAWFVPGSIDAHWHLGAGAPEPDLADLDPSPYQSLIRAATELREIIRRGTTTIRVPHGWPQGIGALQRAILEGAVEGPRVVHSGIPLGSTNDPDVEVVVARRGFGGGADQLVVGECARPKAPETAVRIAVDEARRRGMTVAVHTASRSEALTSIRLGATVLEGVPDGAADELILALKNSGAVLIPLLASSDVPGKREFVARAHREGVAIAAGSGTARLNDELDALREAGLDGAAVARAVGVNAARAVGLGSAVGTLAEGLLADVAVFARDPFPDDPIRDPAAVLHVYRSSDQIVTGRA